MYTFTFVKFNVKFVKKLIFEYEFRTYISTVTPTKTFVAIGTNLLPIEILV